MEEGTTVAVGYSSVGHVPLFVVHLPSQMTVNDDTFKPTKRSKLYFIGLNTGDGFQLPLNNVHVFIDNGGQGCCCIIIIIWEAHFYAHMAIT